MIIVSTSPTVRGQFSPRFHVEAWLPSRHSEMDYCFVASQDWPLLYQAPVGYSKLVMSLSKEVQLNMSRIFSDLVRVLSLNMERHTLEVQGKYRRIPKVTTLVAFGFSSPWITLLSGGRYFRIPNVCKHKETSMTQLNILESQLLYCAGITRCHPPS